MRSRAVRAALVGAALLGVAPAACAATAAAVTSPQAGLSRASSELGTLAASARTTAARSLLRAAQSSLATAAVPSLWIDARHSVAPPYGATVFGHSRTALVRLEHVASADVPADAVAAVERSVLAADRSLAIGAIRQATGGVGGGLLQRAAGMILSGDRWSETSRLDLGAVQYGAASRWAFEALRETVELRASLVSTKWLGLAGEKALGRSSVAPAGVRTLSGLAPLTSAGKPEVLFVGTQSCRFCAIERWGLVAALSQFGSFSLLGLSQSATTQPPIVRSVTFHGSTYESFYVSFDAIELTSDVPGLHGGGYQSLDRLTPAQRTLVRSLDPAGTVPFVDVANQFADVGATVSRRSFSGLPWGVLSAELPRPKTPTGLAIAATAEVFTAEICRATGGVPAPVCGPSGGSNAVADYTSRLPQFGGRGGGCPIPAVLRRRP